METSKVLFFVEGCPLSLDSNQNPLPTHGLMIYMVGGASPNPPDNNFDDFGTLHSEQNEKSRIPYDASNAPFSVTS